ncbi:hypothetical protein DMN50_15440 [Priestia megaterium]|nr:hypothetical protein DMN50_15440 [Priestia megaterium]
MTLIAGVKLPRGILLVSDTRETIEESGEVLSDRRRKIIVITRKFFLGLSGHEGADLASRILRSALYNKEAKLGLTNDYVRETTLKLFSSVNEVHQPNNLNGEPVGNLLGAEYDQDNDDFNLLYRFGGEGFNEFDVLNNVKDVMLVGATHEIQRQVSFSIKTLLNAVPDHVLNNPAFHVELSREIQRYIKIVTENYTGVGEYMYCTYLCSVDKVPAHNVYLLKPDGTQIRTILSDDSRYFKELNNLVN